MEFNNTAVKVLAVPACVEVRTHNANSPLTEFNNTAVKVLAVPACVEVHTHNEISPLTEYNNTAVMVLTVPVCVEVWHGSPACRSHGRRQEHSTPFPWWQASDSGHACCSPAA